MLHGSVVDWAQCVLHGECRGPSYTVPKEIDFPRYNMKFSGGNVILPVIFHAVSCFPLHFMLYRGHFDCFSNRVRAYCMGSGVARATCVLHGEWRGPGYMLTARGVSWPGLYSCVQNDSVVDRATCVLHVTV